MKEYIDIVLETYIDNSKTVDSEKEYYKALKTLSEQIQQKLDRKKYLVKYSCGKGNKVEVPWICIFNKEITTTAKCGIYIAYLFRKDMQGFYLTITQGITEFKEKYKLEGYTYAKEATRYFRDIIKTNKFSKENINLNVKKGTLGYGYEKTTIISKYYEINNYTNHQLETDLKEIIKIYNNIYENIKTTTYNELIENIINNINVDVLVHKEATQVINKLLNKNEKPKVLTEEEIPNRIKKKSKTTKLNKKRKIDGVKKAAKDVEIGLEGEQLVLEHEKNKLIHLGRSDLIEEVKWVAETDDTCGYDIISYNIDNNGEEKQIYIEVKTTQGPADNRFIISRNEIETMEKNKDKYWIYRVYKSNSSTPKFYKMNYSEFKQKVKLTVKNYIAEIDE